MPFDYDFPTEAFGVIKRIAEAPDGGEHPDRHVAEWGAEIAAMAYEAGASDGYERGCREQHRRTAEACERRLSHRFTYCREQRIEAAEIHDNEANKEWADREKSVALCVSDCRAICDAPPPGEEETWSMSSVQEPPPDA